MYNSIKEQLTSLVSSSEVFKGVDVHAAVDEFYTRFFPENNDKHDRYVWNVCDGDRDNPQGVGIFSDALHYVLLKQILPGCWEMGAVLDEHSPDVLDDCKAYDVKVWQDGSVDYVSQANSFKNYDLDFNLCCIEGTFFGRDEAAARKALKELTHRINLGTGVYYKAVCGSVE